MVLAMALAHDVAPRRPPPPAYSEVPITIGIVASIMAVVCAIAWASYRRSAPARARTFARAGMILFGACLLAVAANAWVAQADPEPSPSPRPRPRPEETKEVPTKPVPTPDAPP
jgi:threonine/homoserine/homoserine lactone efflux protein